MKPKNDKNESTLKTVFPEVIKRSHKELLSVLDDSVKHHKKLLDAMFKKPKQK